jgi:cardiolipin synthase
VGGQPQHLSLRRGAGLLGARPEPLRGLRDRSFRLNFEITAAVADRDFASEIERMLEDDFAHSRLMAPGEYDAKPWWYRFGVRLARLTAPVQ